MKHDDEAPPPLLAAGTLEERELLVSADADLPDPARRARTMRRALADAREQRSRSNLLFGGAAAAVALAAGTVLWFGSRAPTSALVVHERPSSVAPSASAAPPSVPDALARCSPAVVAAGTAPLIDDLEDGDSNINPVEGRAGFWMIFNDGTGTQLPRLGLQVLGAKIAGGRGESHKALHTSGSKFSKWGAVLATQLNAKRCYDASAYAGLQFWARGRGQVRVLIKMTQVMPAQFGGSCESGCFDGHFADVELTKDWRLVRISWTQLAQAGHGTPLEFDARSLLGIDFSVLPEHTPFDFWIDDLSFTSAN